MANEVGTNRAGAAQPARLRVIDGDTLAVPGTDERIRLSSIDTPETGERARCAAEAEAGAAATAHARALLASARDVAVVRSGQVDRYGRTLAEVRLDGRDMGETLVGLGLARRWEGYRRSWCGRDGELVR